MQQRFSGAAGRLGGALQQFVLRLGPEVSKAQESHPADLQGQAWAQFVPALVL